MKKRNLKPMIISALTAVAMGSIGVGTTFALFTDKAETSISVKAGIVEIANTVEITGAKSLYDTPETVTGGVSATYVNGGTATVNNETHKVEIKKWTPGDEITLSTIPVNKSNVKTLMRLRIVAEGELAPALIIKGKKSTATDYEFAIKGNKNIATGWEAIDFDKNPTAYDLNISFPNTDNEIRDKDDKEGDNKYQEKSASITIYYEAVQGNAHIDDLLDRVNFKLATEEINDNGANPTMSDAFEDLGELLTPAKALEKSFVWSQELDQFAYESSVTSDKYKYFKVYNANLAVADQTFSIFANGWTGVTSVALNGVGFDAADAIGIETISYTNTTGEAHNVVIRTNSHNTVLTINAENDTVTHYGKANKVEITAVDNNNCYNEHGDVAGNINLEKGKVVVHNDCSAGAVVIDMTAAELATVTTLSADNSANKEVPIILNTSEVLWVANPNNDLINPTTNNIIYSSTGGTLPGNFDTMTKEQKEAAIASASEDLIQGVAAIKNTGYATLQAAINAAQNGDTVVLLDNITMSSGEYLMVKKAITLNMNEKTITGKSGSLSLIYVTSNANLTIRGNGTIENQQPSLFNVSANSVLTIYDGNYSADSDVIYLNGSLANVYGGSFTATNTTNHKTWEIVYLKNAALANIYDGTFTTPNGGCYGMVLYDASVVNLGRLGEEGPTINTWRPCVSSNGSASHTVTVNIYSGTYKANRNDVKIDDQNVIQLANATTGETQTLNIYGGYFEQTSHLENSCIFNLRYGGIINLNISGGTFNYGNNSKLFSGYGNDSSGYPSASNITVNVENNIIPKNVTIEVYGSGVVHIPERDFVINQ